MALPPLELFSLKKRPPCCRAAFSCLRTEFGYAAWLILHRTQGQEFERFELARSPSQSRLHFFIARLNMRMRYADRAKVGLLAGGPAWRQSAMHDFLMGVIFVAMVMSPCVMALTVKLDQHK